MPNWLLPLVLLDDVFAERVTGPMLEAGWGMVRWRGNGIIARVSVLAHAKMKCPGQESSLRLHGIVLPQRDDLTTNRQGPEDSRLVGTMTR